ncbi:pyrophosphatase PpaX [Clostridium sp. UBA4548]|uniref:pyrophosphatase PpaX n=1 Tax=Clostridium sp. UBA4548 TaxID=1946361 RepID=UPI0025BB7231|nr:pyrophosphatase PpaX [Clostridium sp. UBA4548]
MIKGILFDLDGTLINTNMLIINSFKYVFKENLDLIVEDNEIVQYFGEPLTYTMAKYTKDRVEELVQKYVEYSLSIHDEYTESFKGVEEGLIILREKGYKLAIVTSKRRTTALRGLRLFDLEKYFEVIVSPEDTEKHKPEGEPVLKACELLKLEPDEVLMVGDSHNDILCGKNAGAKTCLVKYTALPLEKLLEHKPDYVIDSVEEILNVI